MRDPMYEELAGFLARLNELSLDQVMDVQRANTKSAIHALMPEEMTEKASARWDTLFAHRRLDEPPYVDLELVTMTYCLRQYDSRRVVVALDVFNRRMYALWWDPQHEVSGDDGRESATAPCHDDACFHRSGA